MKKKLFISKVYTKFPNIYVKSKRIPFGFLEPKKQQKIAHNNTQTYLLNNLHTCLSFSYFLKNITLQGPHPKYKIKVY